MQSAPTQSQVSEIDPVTVEVHVEVPWENVQRGLDDTYVRLQKTARVKGFRPGKAPRAVLQQLFAKSVREEVASNLVEKSILEAVQKHELPVVSAATLREAPTVNDGKPLAFTARLEVRPKIESLDTGIALTRRPLKVDDAAVDAELERLRQQRSTIEPLDAARPAQKGDVLTIDFKATVEGQKEDELAADRYVELGDGRLLPEIETALIGAEPGAVKTVEITRGEDDANKEIAGKKITFEVTVKEIRARKLPTLDDEFAKDVGDHENLAALRGKLKTDIETREQTAIDRELRDQAVEKLIEKNKIPVPPSLVDQQLRAMAQEFTQIMQMSGQAPRLDRQFLDGMKPRAEDRVRAALLLGELSRRESIKVESSDIEARLKEIAERSGKHIAKVRVEYQGERREQLETQLLEDKLLKHLLSVASVTEGEPQKESA